MKQTLLGLCFLVVAMVATSSAKAETFVTDVLITADVVEREDQMKHLCYRLAAQGQLVE